MSQLGKVRIAISAAALALCWAGAAHAQGEWRTDRAVYFTFSQPVVLPHTTLPPGKYEFKLASSNTTRNVIQVYSGDGSKLYGMMTTIPVQRETTPDKPEIRFMETAAGQPSPIQSYFFPGMKIGWEFVYPRQQALNLAKSAKQPVLTTTDTVADSKMDSAALARVDASGHDTSVAASNSPAPIAMNGASEEGEVAAAPPTAATGQAATSIAADESARQSTSPAPARSRLPETASATPLVALVGLSALVAGLALATRRRVV